MQKTALHFQKPQGHTGGFLASPTNDSVNTSELPRLIEYWLSDCQISQHSIRTIELRRSLAGRLLWFLDHCQASECGAVEMRRFFAYLVSGEQQSVGRWENPQYNKPLRPATVNTYFRHLGSFFNWLVCEELLLSSPITRITPPSPQADQVQPFSLQQVEDIICAAKKSKYASRDEAIVRFLFDTGVRATELCTLQMKNADLVEGKFVVLGKGNKSRTVYLCKKARRCLRTYLHSELRTPEDPVFTAERGNGVGGKLTRSGLLQLIHRLGNAANIEVVRCSPHTFRHTFAIQFLRNGGNTMTLMHLMGHTTLQMTLKYVALAQADMQEQHRQYSLGDCLKV